MILHFPIHPIYSRQVFQQRYGFSKRMTWTFQGCKISLVGECTDRRPGLSRGLKGLGGTDSPQMREGRKKFFCHPWVTLIRDERWTAGEKRCEQGTQWRDLLGMSKMRSMICRISFTDILKLLRSHKTNFMERFSLPTLHLTGHFATLFYCCRLDDQWEGSIFRWFWWVDIFLSIF